MQNVCHIACSHRYPRYTHVSLYSLMHRCRLIPRPHIWYFSLGNAGKREPIAAMGTSLRLYKAIVCLYQCTISIDFGVWFLWQSESKAGNF